MKIRRSQLKTFLNTGTILSPTWTLIGDGVTAGKISYNPKVTEEQYIHEDNATTTVESYAPNMPVEMTAINGDAVYEFIDSQRIGRDILEDVEAEIVNVWLYKTNAIGYYAAEKQSVALQVDDYGGDAGKPAKINYTINYLGDPVIGFFHPAATIAFYPAPVDTTLTSLSVGGHTLTPVFNSNWGYYSLDVTSSTDTITVVADDESADIVIDVDATPVVNGEDATWEEGLNTLTVEVTVGSEVFNYIVEVTYTAP